MGENRGIPKSHPPPSLTAPLPSHASTAAAPFAWLATAAAAATLIALARFGWVGDDGSGGDGGGDPAATGPSPPVTSSSGPRSLASGRRPRYVFACSTGHSGSTSLGNVGTYTPDSSIAFRFEQYLGGSVSDWKQWWDSSPHPDEQLKRVQRFKSSIDEVMRRTRVSTYVDMGHHILQGILPYIPEVFGKDAVIVRMRRARFATVHSFFKPGKKGYGVCSLWYRICPHMRSVVLTPRNQPWSPDLFRNLTQLDEFFWFVDEVEAEWQQLVQRYPDMPRAECSWTADPSPCFRIVASILEVGVANGGDGMSVRHHTKHSGTSDPKYHLADLAYQAKMQYAPQQLALIQKVQF